MSKAARRRKRYAPTIYALHAAGYNQGQIASMIDQSKSFVQRVLTAENTNAVHHEDDRCGNAQDTPQG